MFSQRSSKVPFNTEIVSSIPQCAMFQEEKVHRARNVFPKILKGSLQHRDRIFHSTVCYVPRRESPQGSECFPKDPQRFPSTQRSYLPFHSVLCSKKRKSTGLGMFSQRSSKVPFNTEIVSSIP